MQDKFFDTSIVICATSPHEKHSQDAYRKINEGEFYICRTVFQQLNRIAERRLKIFKKILQVSSDNIEFQKTSVGKLIDEFINQTEINYSYDGQAMVRAFDKILSINNLQKTQVMTLSETEQFLLAVNEVFSAMINRFEIILHDLNDTSYSVKHIIPKYTTDKHTKLFRTFFKKFKANKKDDEDILIITNASYFAYEKCNYLYFVSNDKIHLNNIKCFYSTICDFYEITAPEDHYITIKPLEFLAN